MVINAENKVLTIQDLGLTSYRQVLALQEQMHLQRRDGAIGDTVLILEHRPVVTLGARKSANKLLVSEEELNRRGIDVVEIRRGGGTTVHNPGQLIFYPILNLHRQRLDIGRYVRTLERIGIELLDHFGLICQRREGYPGLWAGPRKIASIGVRVSRWITYHGMAININNDLSLFDLMVPCGLDDVTMTSLQRETGVTHEMEAVKKQLATLLNWRFGGNPR